MEICRNQKSILTDDVIVMLGNHKCSVKWWNRVLMGEVDLDAAMQSEPARLALRRPSQQEVNSKCELEFKEYLRFHNEMPYI